MDEPQPTAIRRRPADIHRDLEAKRHHYDVLRRLAADFAAIDCRPFFIRLDTFELTYTRDFHIPENLRTMIRDEAAAIRALEQELYV